MNCIQPSAPAEETLSVGAEGGLDLVDPGQDRRALRAEPVGRRGPLVHRDQDRRHAAGRAGGGGQGGDREGGRGAGDGERAGGGFRRGRRFILSLSRFAAVPLVAGPFAGVDAAARRRGVFCRRRRLRRCRRDRRRQGRSLNRRRGGGRRARRFLQGGAWRRRHRALGAGDKRCGKRDRGDGGRGDRADLLPLAHHPSTLVTRHPSPFRFSISSRSSLVSPTRSSETLTG